MICSFIVKLLVQNQVQMISVHLDFIFGVCIVLHSHIINYLVFSGIEHETLISHFPWARTLGMAELGPLLRVLPGWNQGVSLDKSLAWGSESFSKLTGYFQSSVPCGYGIQFLEPAHHSRAHGTFYDRTVCILKTNRRASLLLWISLTFRPSFLKDSTWLDQAHWWGLDVVTFVI